MFQAKMLDMLKQTGRPEMVVGWYHSHPGFGCWLSGVDINTQQSFEALSERAVAVVVDPIQSVKGLYETLALEVYQLQLAWSARSTSPSLAETMNIKPHLCFWLHIFTT